MGLYTLASLSSPRRVPSARGTQASFIASPGSFLYPWLAGRRGGASWSWAVCQVGLLVSSRPGSLRWYVVGRSVIFWLL